MKTKDTNIWVYANWFGMPEPCCIGLLKAVGGKGKTVFSFEYDKDWIKSDERFILDPDIRWYSGVQFPEKKTNFGIFLDSMPDTWGRTLMKRNAAQTARENNEAPMILHETDYLLGVYDACRMGALRFKTDKTGPFLDDNIETPVPPWSSIRELQFASDKIQSDSDDPEIKKWLSILFAPGSSLGGARPKANISDENGDLWIAKFPSKNDTIDKAAWEFLAYKLALRAGIKMSESKIQKVSGKDHTFFTKRFDRIGKLRIHFASAMTMTGNDESFIRDAQPSYMELAEFIQFSGGNIKEDLHQLWKRMVFNIAVSNTDDHLRNHGFIIINNEWRLSPAYDINPSIDKPGLSLNIDLDNNDLDFELAKSVAEYFKLNTAHMEEIIKEVRKSVISWPKVAKEIGISKSEQEMMSAAFRY
jgi:serine/threonine-protein kinase HipA